MKNKLATVLFLFYIICISCHNTNSNKNSIDNNKSNNMNSDSLFYYKVFNDYRVGGYFINIDISCNEKQIKNIVIENSTFYNFLNKYDGALKMEDYSSKAIENKFNQKPFNVSSTIYEKLESYKVDENINIKETDVKSIRNKYFENDKILKQLDDGMEKQIIKVLFNNKVGVHRDDESGYIVIDPAM